MDSPEIKKAARERHIEEYVIFFIIAVTAAGIHLISCGSVFTGRNECQTNCRRVNAECISDCRQTYNTSSVSDEFRDRHSGFHYLRETSIQNCSERCSKNYHGCLERCSENLIKQNNPL